MLNLSFSGIYSRVYKFLITDSEQVPWGKGEKTLQRCVKRTWNPILYSVEGFINIKLTSYLLYNGPTT